MKRILENKIIHWILRKDGGVFINYVASWEIWNFINLCFMLDLWFIFSMLNIFSRNFWTTPLRICILFSMFFSHDSLFLDLKEHFFNEVFQNTVRSLYVDIIGGWKFLLNLKFLKNFDFFEKNLKMNLNLTVFLAQNLNFKRKFNHFFYSK